MPLFCWDDEEGGNVEHIAEHGLTVDDVEHAFENVIKFTTSRSTKRPALFGYALDQRTIFVAYDQEMDDDGDEVIFVTTAFEVGTS